MAMATHQNEVAIVMIPLPLYSHLNQLIHLSHLIDTFFHIPIHFTQPTNPIHYPKFHHPNLTISPNIHTHDFHIPPPPSTSFLLFLHHVITHLRHPILRLSQQLSPQFKRLIIIHDFLMSSIAQPIVKSNPNVEAYTFYPISTFSIFFSSWESLPQKPFHLDSSSLHIPTDEGILPTELAEFMASQSELNFEFESGRVFNTCRLIEGRFIDLLQKLISSKRKSSHNNNKIKQFLFGPLIPVEIIKGKEESINLCVQWLDEQEPDSVILVSFGTTTSINYEQLKEIAIGLERSGQKFIWVLRNNGNRELGFEDRVNKNQGLVVRDWVPQLKILAHGSTGGFMSHCGWSSCMESISMGVPMLAWPMHSDQPKNSTLITQVLKIGFLVRNWENREEIVSSDVVENVVRNLMVSDEGRELRKRAKDLGFRVQECSVANGGESLVEMESFVAHITR